MHDKPGQDELYFYTFTGVLNTDRTIEVEETIDGLTREYRQEFSHNNRPVLFDTASIKLVWLSIHLVLMAYTYGVKIYRFNEHFEQLWDQQVMPAHPWLWVPSLNNNADLSINDAGEIFVAFEVLGDEVRAYEWHFGRILNKTTEDRDIAVSVYDTAGQYLRSFVVGNAENHEILAGMFYKESSLWFGANVRRNKFAEPNYTSEWDLLLLEASPDQGSTLQYHIIDHRSEDFAEIFTPLPNGDFMFGGTTGFRQVDSNSIVSHGSGILLAVSSTGDINNAVVLERPRHVVVESVLIADKGDVIFSGIYDAPITHTCDYDDSLCYQKSMVGKTKLYQAD